MSKIKVLTLFLLRILFLPAAAAAESLQSCPAPCDPIDGSPPGSPIPGILQARVLEWCAIAFSDDYTLEVTNRFKGLDLIDRVPDELWMEVHDVV